MEVKEVADVGKLIKVELEANGGAKSWPFRAGSRQDNQKKKTYRGDTGTAEIAGDTLYLETTSSGTGSG